MRALAVTFLLAACSSSSKAPSTNPPPTGAGETSCASDSDCVVVETVCCDHCNGGKVEAYNTAFADKHKPTGCKDTACTDKGCGEASASCDAGTCKITIAPVR